MSLPVLKFWWEWKAASPFWPADAGAIQRFGSGEIETTRLDLPPQLVEELVQTAAWHDTALNWSYPPDPGPWRQEECDRFNAASEDLFDRCEKLFIGRFSIEYAHREEKEDPDLDSYLAAPSSFKRMPTPKGPLT